MTMDRRTFRIGIIVASILGVAIVSFLVARNRRSWMSPERVANAVKTAINTSKAKEPPNDCPEFDFRNVPQDDPNMIEYVRNEILLPPSALQYRLDMGNRIDFSEVGQSKYADVNYLHGMKDGFFIEAGATDGEIGSISLYLERVLGWQGILIEPIPYLYEKLVKRHRKAYSANVALAPEPMASEQIMTMKGKMGVKNGLGEKGFTVKAIPLYTLLQALGVHVVDFMSLDIQSSEYKVLNTIPWGQVKFRLMCIEVTRIPEGVPKLKELLRSKGYKYLGQKSADMWFGLPELLKPLNKTKKG